jgi:hypothetical protein
MKRKMTLKSIAALLVSAFLVTPGYANEGSVPKGVPHLDHVFVIMMENHGYSQIVDNPSAPFANQLAKTANIATNYFAVGHPSLTNYLELNGGSNFGIRSDNNPDWGNTNCQTNLSTGTVNTDFPASPNVCPIWGTGTDAATPAIDTTNECPNPAVLDPCPPGLLDLDGVRSIAAASNISGKTIADQLTEYGKNWKSYQESLPSTGAYKVDFSDGYFTDTSNIPSVIAGETQTLIELYAAKHDPFVYFRSVEENQIDHVVGFEGKHGLYDDLASGDVPAYSFIAPNQCNDQHGRGNAGPQCDYDPNDNGTQTGLNPALIFLGDQALRTIVKAIKASPVWSNGNNAIVILWDENDYSYAPNVNQVLTIVDTNYGPHGIQSNKSYTHFSLLRTIEGGLGLPCLNHACDSGTGVMSDLFGSGKDHDRDGDHDGDDGWH